MTVVTKAYQWAAAEFVGGGADGAEVGVLGRGREPAENGVELAEVDGLNGES
jgi:hypothetical protein